MTTTAADRAQDAEIAKATRKENGARDRAIHVALGLCPHPLETWYHEGPDGDRTLNCGLCHSRSNLLPLRYSSDPAAFESLMQEIGRRGLGKKWSKRVCDQLAASAEMRKTMGHDDYPFGLVWAIASAPQSTKAAAALAALREAKP
jgi:hypothetical protein